MEKWIIALKPYFEAEVLGTGNLDFVQESWGLHRNIWTSAFGLLDIRSLEKSDLDFWLLAFGLSVFSESIYCTS